MKGVIPKKMAVQGPPKVFSRKPTFRVLENSMRINYLVLFHAAGCCPAGSLPELKANVYLVLLFRIVNKSLLTCSIY
jgi:hypothetical protein